MKNVGFWVLSAFVGIVCSLLILLICGPLHLYITAGLAAGVVAGVLYYGFLAKSNMKLLISVVIAIIVYILYYLLYSYVNFNFEFNAETFLIPFLIFTAPYIFASYLFFAIRAIKNTTEGASNDNNDTEDKQ